MNVGPNEAIFEALFRAGTAASLSDDQLLERYVDRCDINGQLAFEAIVRRHGPMVCGVCRRVLDDSHAAEDAFQATFLVLALRARSVGGRGPLGPWLHGVAVRVSRRARRLARRQQGAVPFPEDLSAPESRDCDLAELRLVLDEELSRLPDKYRRPVVLCYLEGRTQEDAALALGWTKGTVSGRLARAKDLLRRRLMRRGLVSSAGLIGGVLSFKTASAAVPRAQLSASVRTTTAEATIQAAIRITAGQLPVGVVPAVVESLTRGVLTGMIAHKLRNSVVVAIWPFGIIATFLGSLSYSQAGDDPFTARDPASASVAQATTQTPERPSSRDETAPKPHESEAASTKAVSRLAEVLKGGPETIPMAVSRLAEVLKRYPPPHRSGEGERLRLYMRDLIEGGTTLIVDEPAPGLDRCGSATWSHDGRRIIFDVRPGYQFTQTRLMAIDVRDGRPLLTDLGLGDTPTFAPDDKRIAFGLSSGEDSGVYVMEVNGSERHRAGDYGAPFWSPDGRKVLINSNTRPTEVRVVNLETSEETLLKISLHHIFSWPSWAGPDLLVASIGVKEGDTIALLDVSRPTEVKVVDFLWKRDEELDVTPLWPVYGPRTQRCYFVGLKGSKRTLYSIQRGGPVRAKMMETRGYQDKLGGLSLSPDGRYLLFCADRPEQQPR